ncbi:MAG: serine/threonine protein kinase [Gemmataceae bacterium]|nr:serine/threonine protein kinase [Gemmataceae bacterium]
MAIASSAGFVETLRESGVFEPARIDRLILSLKEHPRDAKQLAQECIEDGSLTTYQARELLLGRASELVLGPYIVLAPAGMGRVGDVFRARHRKRGHIVAVKVIRKNLRADARVLQRFRREVRAIACLSHPNLIRACDLEEVGNAHFYAMEYVAGINLDELIETTGRLPVAAACDYMRQAALGLQHAHEHGLVHRDIKPANLLVAPALAAQLAATSTPTRREGHWGTIKVLDLGFALLHQSFSATGDQANLTVLGSVLGTVDYMAPEQVQSPHEVDIRADLYGLGCVFYHLLTGRPPFPDGSLMQKLTRRGQDEPVPVELLRPEVPPSLAGVLRKMMAKRPEARYQQPAQAAEALATILARLGETLLALDWQPPRASAEHRGAGNPRKGTSSPPMAQTQPWIVLLLLAIFGAVFAATWLLLSR